MQTTTSEIDWKGLTKDIINNKCVLVLGPEFCKTADKSFTKQLSNHLVESILKQKNIQPQEKDWLEKEKHNLFYTSQK